MYEIGCWNDDENNEWNLLNNFKLEEKTQNHLVWIQSQKVKIKIKNKKITSIPTKYLNIINKLHTSFSSL
jgi:hypothetical protein